MRYDITHITRYEYRSSVSHCLNVAYMLPRNIVGQSCLSDRVVVSPEPTQVSERVDYFGNRAFHFTVEQEHKVLEITACSTVEVDRAAENQGGLDFGNTVSRARELLHRSQDPECLLAREFQLASPMVNWNDALHDYAAPFFEESRPFLSAVHDLMEAIFKDFAFDADFSDLSTPITEIFEHRKGVCQDFAHLAIACLRALGFPARYVSGYIETLPPPGEQKLVGADATHAWFAVYSPEEGWFEFDPTNNTMAGDHHILTAWGRDYSDVSPLKGVVFGGGSDNQLSVSVDVRRHDSHPA